MGLALLLTGAFMGVEFVVGWWSHSLALVADAGHMLGDTGALALAYWVASVAQRPRSRQCTYGYRRAEVLGALFSSLMLGVISLWVGTRAIERLMSTTPDIHGHGLLATAFVGLIVNLCAAWILHRQGGHNINVRAALLHVIGDVLGSVLAIGAGIAVIAGYPFTDALASLAIGLLLLWGCVRLVREASHVLMEGAPPHLDVDAVERAIAETPGVRSVHDLHVWSLTPDVPMLTAHVVIAPGAHGTDVAKRVGERLHDEFHLEHVTIQPEPAGPAHVPLRLRKSGKT